MSPGLCDSGAFSWVAAWVCLLDSVSWGCLFGVVSWVCPLGSLSWFAVCYRHVCLGSISWVLSLDPKWDNFHTRGGTPCGNHKRGRLPPTVKLSLEFHYHKTVIAELHSLFLFSFCLFYFAFARCCCFYENVVVWCRLGVLTIARWMACQPPCGCPTTRFPSQRKV